MIDAQDYRILVAAQFADAAERAERGEGFYDEGVELPGPRAREWFERYDERLIENYQEDQWTRNMQRNLG